jgi:hypothetical protein
MSKTAIHLGKLTRETWVSPAWDKRDKDPAKNYGIGGCQMFWAVKGKDGAITLSISTGWYLPQNRTDTSGSMIGIIKAETMPIDLGIHSRKPLDWMSDDDDMYIMHDCPYTSDDKGKGADCYYDGSGLQAQKYFELLIEKGSDELFKALEERYHSTWKGDE